MARVADSNGRQVEGTYLDPDGLRNLIKQLHGTVQLLDGLAADNGDNGTASASYGKDPRITGAQYLAARNASTLRNTRRTVRKLAATYRDLLDGAVRLVDDHVARDEHASADVHHTRR